MDKLKCPICGWSSRVSYLSRTDQYKCGHCGHTWDKK
jgi:transposase-like protein